MIEGANAFYMEDDVGIPPINLETHTELIFKGFKFHQVAALYQDQKMKGHLEHLLQHQDEVLAYDKRINSWKTIEVDDDPPLEKRIKTEETEVEGFIKANPKPKPALEDQEFEEEEKQAQKITFPRTKKGSHRQEEEESEESRPHHHQKGEGNQHGEERGIRTRTSKSERNRQRT